MACLNLGILAHVDAGKTSLTERLLHAAGVVDEPGSVDRGSTRTDTLELERRRGITIKSAVVSFAVHGVTVNLIDTPGHPDFVAEVERVLGVLDGAVLVVSAVEGVQAQTRVLMRTLRRLGIPTLVFVNKIDRRGADEPAVLRAMAQRLTPALVAMGTTAGAGDRDARFVPHDGARLAAELVPRLAEHDDELLAAFVDDTAVAPERARRALATQTARTLVHPVFFGSAITGAGVDELTEGIATLLPTSGGDPDGPVSGTVFKIERGAAGERIAYARLFSGTVRVRDRLPAGRVTAIRVFDDGEAVPRGALGAGRIGTLVGLRDVRIGDPIGEPPPGPPGRGQFAPPSLESVVVPDRPGDRGALYAALAQLAEQDPLIDLRQDDRDTEPAVSLYGEVQKEVITATLAEEFGIRVTFRETTTLCVERVVGTGEAAEVIDTGANPFLATVGLRVEPGEPGSGVRFDLEVELGSMPPAFFTAVRDGVTATLRRGLRGWQVGDCVVTMTRSGYWARQSHSHGTFDKSMSSTATDFRNLTPLVLRRALAVAGTSVHEPVHRFRLEIPADALIAVLPVLARLDGVPGPPRVEGTGCVVDGEIPAARVHELEQRLPGLTRGEALLDAEFARYREVRGRPPTRPSTATGPLDGDPLDPDDYLRRLRQGPGLR
ncbi:elongation factor G [Pseudonocardia humida]|uniref:TetM/TetW/TetO/TetS family tetracycline resistance ribosomal protection protein n=1 Tax=Pseudonocardia humida TaxID=2800819 RepID=A0ABT1A9F1_9PSEU|nr:TetM/TetW/TetO/TetS family tetracycline resistance ribosomal protection protein [Pseudonocardia humida]MCO1659459.1 TetM/TetW/TetO/TetS family tetracycline resistance ribosomal protection protein [Pseudonocardia humida]